MSSGLFIFNNQRILLPAVIVMAALLTSGCSTFSRFDFPVFGLEKEAQDTSSVTSNRKDAGDNGEYYRSIYRPGGVPRSDITRSELPPDSLYDEPRRQRRTYEEPARDYDGYKESRYDEPRDYSEQRSYSSYEKKPKVFVVRPGDNLYRIARNNGVELKELKRVNGLTNNNISVGQELILPGNGIEADTYRPKERIAKRTFRPTKNRKVSGYYPSRTVNRRVEHQRNDYGSSRQSIKRHNVVRPPEEITDDGNEQREIRQKEIKQAYRPEERTQVQPEAKRTLERKKYKMPKGSGLFRWPAEGRIISRFGKKRNGVRNDGVNLSLPMGN